MPSTAKHIRMLLTKGSKRRSGKLLPKVRFIVAHDVGIPNAPALNNAKFYARTQYDESASAHFFVDDKYIIECIPVYADKPEKAWHVHYDRPEDNRMYGDDANDAAIGVEFSYGGSVNTEASYRNYTWLLAKLCYDFKLNPKTDIVGHMVLDPARRSDPQNAMRTIGKKYPKDLINDVSYIFNTEFKGKVMEGDNVDTVKIQKPDNTTAEGVIIANKSYIKVADLVSLGFEVTWDAETRTVKIDKK